MINTIHRACGRATWQTVLMALLSMLASASLWAATTQVRTQVHLGGVKVVAHSLVQADARTLWQTLTDYNRLASFVPGMTLSRVISPANAAPKLVEQKGDGGLLALVIPDHVVMEINEQAPGLIRFRSKSRLARMQGEWRIIGDRAPVTLQYQADILTVLPPPPLLTDDYVSNEIRLRIDAVAGEAERRMRLRH